MTYDAVVAFKHITDILLGVGSPCQLLCSQNKINDHRKLRAKLKNIRDLEYIDPITGTNAKLSDNDFYEISTLQSFLNAMQNETGPIDSCPIDITQFSRDDFLRYLDDWGWYDPDNPTNYDYALAKEAEEHNKNMEELVKTSTRK